MNHRSNSKKASDAWDKIFIDTTKSKNYTKEQILIFRNTKDNNYGSIEEKNVIENRETQTAIKHGEINNEKHSRDDHYGDTFTTNNPTQNYQHPPMYSFFYIMWGR